LAREFFFQSSAISLFELESLEVWEFDDFGPISRRGSATRLADQFQLSNLGVAREERSLGKELSQNAAARETDTQTSSPLA
jgi:hypothetical protein